ncbi:hypothetical protein [Jiangella endophytica]|nr:hypothetical protein [Jiangella endophytica]
MADSGRPLTFGVGLDPTDPAAQPELFTSQVVPAVRERVAERRGAAA